MLDPVLLNEKVLVVDDDSFGLSFFKSSLEMLKYEVHTAMGVDEAKEVLLQHGIENFSCVLTDFRMPRQTGLDLLEWIQSSDEALATVIVTAEGEKDLVRDSLRGGAADFLEKPVSYELLGQTIKRAIEQTVNARRLQETDEGVRAASQMSHIFLSFKAKAIEDRIRYYYKPLHEVGGDFLNVLELEPNRYLVVAGDVSGHDVKAAFVSAYFQGIVRGLQTRKLDQFSEPIELFNKILLEDWSGQKEAGKISVPISLALCAIDIDLNAGKLRVLNCGCPPASLVHQEAYVLKTQGRNAPLGWVDVEGFSIDEMDIKDWNEIYLFSDGASDYAEHLGVDSFSLIYKLLTNGNEAFAEFHETPPDDILIMSLLLNETGNDFLPLIHEQYTGSEADDIDKLQNVWRRSLMFSIGDELGDRLYDLLLCCREGVINALVHGCDKSSEKVCEFQVSYAKEQGVVRVRIDDPGKGHDFNIKERMKELGSYNGRHLGLSIIHDLSDHILSENEGSSLVFDFSLKVES